LSVFYQREVGDTFFPELLVYLLMRNLASMYVYIGRWGGKWGTEMLDTTPPRLQTQADAGRHDAPKFAGTEASVAGRGQVGSGSVLPHFTIIFKLLHDL
jgi:hypothetical protein